ncbi:MAG: hypothetical protein ACRDF9_02795, partial [Candidatus Limnocylindria bacterium]
MHTCGAVELRHVLGARQFERSWFEHELFPLAERLERPPAAALPQVLAGKQLFMDGRGASQSNDALSRAR